MYVSSLLLWHMAAPPTHLRDEEPGEEVRGEVEEAHHVHVLFRFGFMVEGLWDCERVVWFDFGLSYVICGWDCVCKFCCPGFFGVAGFVTHTRIHTRIHVFIYAYLSLEHAGPNVDKVAREVVPQVVRLEAHKVRACDMILNSVDGGYMMIRSHTYNEGSTKGSRPN